MEIKQYVERVAVIFMHINRPKIGGINCNNGLARTEFKLLVGGWGWRRAAFSLEIWMWFCALSFLLSHWKETKRNLNFFFFFFPVSTTFGRKLKVSGLIYFLKMYAAMASFP